VHGGSSYPPSGRAVSRRLRGSCVKRARSLTKNRLLRRFFSAVFQLEIGRSRKFRAHACVKRATPPCTVERDVRRSFGGLFDNLGPFRCNGMQRGATLFSYRVRNRRLRSVMRIVRSPPCCTPGAQRRVTGREQYFFDALQIETPAGVAVGWFWNCCARSICVRNHGGVRKTIASKNCHSLMLCGRERLPTEQKTIHVLLADGRTLFRKGLARDPPANRRRRVDERDRPRTGRRDEDDRDASSPAHAEAEQAPGGGPDEIRGGRRADVAGVGVVITRHTLSLPGTQGERGERGSNNQRRPASRAAVPSPLPSPPSTWERTGRTS
jgi:hypothetical protein